MSFFRKLFGGGATPSPAIPSSASAGSAMPPPLAGTAQADVFSPERFTDICASRMRNVLPSLQVEVKGPLLLSTVAADGNIGTLDLRNDYQFYVSGHKTLEHTLADRINSTQDWLSSAKQVDRQSIMPSIKHVEYFRELNARAAEVGAPPPDLPSIRLGGDLCLLFVLDTEHSMSPLDRDAQKELGLDDAGLLAVAKDNLRTFCSTRQLSLQTLALGEDGAAGRLLIPELDGNYEAALMLWDDLWTDPSIGLDGPPAFFPANRNRLVVVNRDNPVAMAVAAQLAQGFSAELPYVIDPRGYIREGDGWVLAPGQA